MCLNTDDTHLVEPDDACPLCGERRPDMLEWIDDDLVRCTLCSQEYRPGTNQPR